MITKEQKLFADTPIGKIQIPEWEVTPLFKLSDEDLFSKAIQENKSFCISPATFAMIEKRSLGWQLQQMINPSVGFRHAGSKFNISTNELVNQNKPC